MKRLTVSIIIPTLNEEKNLERVLKDIKNIPRKIDEIIVVDGHSKDKTVQVAKRHGCRIIMEEPPLGKGYALRLGMSKAKRDVIINMDADCSNMATEIPLLIAGIEAGYDVVMGSRFLQGGGTEDMPFIRVFGNKFFVTLVNLLWKMKYSDLAYGYRAFNRKAIRKMKLRENGFGIETEMSIQSAKKKLKVLEVPSFEKNRMYGVGKLQTFKDGFKILKTIVKQVFN